MGSDEALQGRVAVITGGTQGIGASTARLFVSQGASVILVARSPDRGSALVQELGDAAAFVQGDVADPDTARRAVKAAVDVFGRLDILVNNAAVDYSGVRLLDAEPSDVTQVFEVNAFGSIFMLKEAALRMEAEGGGAVVNVISRAGLVGIPGMAVYGASKAAIAGLTRAAAVELAPLAIRVNAVAPGATETPMMRSWIDEQPDPVDFEGRLVAGLLEERLARPQEVADAILFLSSSSSSYITGACLSIDGGYTAM